MYTFNISGYAVRGPQLTYRIIPIHLNIVNKQSPFVLALQKLEEESKLSPKTCTVIYLLKKSLERMTSKIAQHLNISITQHTRESFDDLLYLIEQTIDTSQLSHLTKYSEAVNIRSLLKRNNQALGDGTFISSCVKDYVTIFRRAQIKNGGLRQLSAISHSNVADLEEKAKYVTKKMLDDMTQACQKEINQYLRICEKQNNFANYKFLGPTKEYLYHMLENMHKNYFIKDVRRTDILKAVFCFLKEKNTLSFTPGSENYTSIPNNINAALLRNYSHYRSGNSTFTWYYSQYRLPNYILTCCFILLLIKTGWNIGSVAYLKVNDIKKLRDGSYEIQSSKHKTDDETPKVHVSKADKIFKTCLSLLLWNHSQLVKYSLIRDEDESIWYGWQKTYEYTFYPINKRSIDLFFDRHKLPKICLSEIRPLKSSFNFLTSRDIELIRITLGHSDLETTALYLESNLLSQLNKSRILEFQKRLESTIAHQTCSESEFSIRGFKNENIDLNIFGKKLKLEKTIDQEFLDGAKYFLVLIGSKANHNSLIISPETITQATLLKKYYCLRWRKLYDINPEYFVQNHLNTIIYLHVFLRIVRERKPSLLKI